MGVIVFEPAEIRRKWGWQAKVKCFLSFSGRTDFPARLGFNTPPTSAPDSVEYARGR
jgi:hypothetical protein